ncbi:MAG TPA: hypothetical protein ENK42_06405 [Deltaproteobacteria bacterium]|nr:hypothetical protein [Deltaproteobacteria bacterium]
MKNRVKGVLSMEAIFGSAIRVALSLLMAVLIGVMFWLAIGLALNVIDHIQAGNIHEIAKDVLMNALMVLALLEVVKTSLTYFSAGRVKVTYIIDTVIVVVLTEVMGFWFKEIALERFIMVISLIFALIGARILAIKYSPSREEI